MKINLITLKLKDIDFINLKSVAKCLFKETNDPSFNIIAPLLIIGKTTLQNFIDVKIDFIDRPLEFNSIIQSENNISYIASTNSSFLDNLKEKICDTSEINFNSKYFNLFKNINNYPLIHIGNSLDKQININQIIINDYRLEILQIEIFNNGVNYKTLDSIHLSKDKIL